MQEEKSTANIFRAWLEEISVRVYSLNQYARLLKRSTRTQSRQQKTKESDYRNQQSEYGLSIAVSYPSLQDLERHKQQKKLHPSLSGELKSYVKKMICSSATLLQSVRSAHLNSDIVGYEQARDDIRQLKSTISQHSGTLPDFLASKIFCDSLKQIIGLIELSKVFPAFQLI